MKRLFLSCALWLGLMAQAVAAPAFVQGICNADNLVTTTFAATLPAPVTSGNLVVGIESHGRSTTITTILDDKGNAYTVADALNDVTDQQSSTTFYLPNITNGPATVTLTFSAISDFRSLCLMEYSGLSSTPIDGHNAQQQSATTTPTSPSITTTTNGDLIWGSTVNTSSAATAAVAGGLTLRESDVVTSPTYAADLTQSTAGATTTAFTAGSSVWITSIIAFKASGAPPPSGGTIRTLTGAGK